MNASPRKKNLIRAIMIAMVPVLSFFYPFAFNGPDICLFHRMTGIPCPGCGMTRAFFSMAHGRILDSLQYNALGTTIFIGILVLLIFTVLDFFRSTNYYGYVVSNGRLFQSLIVAFVIFGFIRLVAFIISDSDTFFHEHIWIHRCCIWLIRDFTNNTNI